MFDPQPFPVQQPMSSLPEACLPETRRIVKEEASLNVNGKDIPLSPAQKHQMVQALLSQAPQAIEGVQQNLNAQLSQMQQLQDQVNSVFNQAFAQPILSSAPQQPATWPVSSWIPSVSATNGNAAPPFSASTASSPSDWVV
jgi:hypothetical protein